MNYVALTSNRHGETAAPEHIQHREIVGKDVGLQAIQAIRLGDGNDVPQQRTGDPSALEIFLDEEGYFPAPSRCGGGAFDDIARAADDNLILTSADGH